MIELCLVSFWAFVGGEVVGGGEDVGVGKVSHGVGLGWAFGIFVFLLL